MNTFDEIEMFTETALECCRLGEPEEAFQMLRAAARLLPPEPDNGMWQEPTFFTNVETPEIGTKFLPEVLAKFADAVVENTQTPPAMAVMMTLAVVAACVQKKFEVCPFGDSYTEPVNIMTVIALEPGNKKSAVVGAITEPLTAWETEQAELLKDRAARVKHERDIIIKTIDSIKSTASKSSASDDERRIALIEISRLESEMPSEVVPPRKWVDDVTAERLQNLMSDHGEQMAVISAEGGIFDVMAGLYNNGKANIDIFLKGHSGDAVRVERQGRTVTMRKPALTFGLCVQPSVISSLGDGSKARFRGNGMLARFLYCIPKSTIGTRDVSRRRPISESVRQNYNATIRRLLEIPTIHDGGGHEQPRILALEPEALRQWLAFSQWVESKQGANGEFHAIQDWTAKLPGAALRIAGLCHVAEFGEREHVINKGTMARALDLAELLIPHVKATFSLVGRDPAAADAQHILSWIVKEGNESFRRSDLHKAMHGRFQRVERLKIALKELTERHIISDEIENKTGRRPGIIYKVNPAVLKEVGHGLA